MRRRADRGVVLPSPVMLLSIVAVVLAGVAFFVTRGNAPEQKVVTTSAGQSASATATVAPNVVPTPTPTPKPVIRKKVLVEVYNNSRVHGLAATVSQQASTIGWNVVGADNWYGSVPATTVHFPARLRAAGKQLALDLGIKRTAKATDPMKMDRLTVILTGPLS